MDGPTTESPLSHRRPATEPGASPPWYTRPFARVDIASLVWFRVAFGLCMVAHVLESMPKVAQSYIEPEFHFKYFGFQWVEPWPGNWMHVHFLVLLLAAVCITLGAGYRVATVVFFLGISHVFLLEQAFHLNHMYLVSLISFLMILVPAHRAFSVDAWLRPKLRSETAPKWALWLLQAQVGIPYFYGGIAKLNGDWLQAQPLKIWLASRADRPVIGPLLAQEWVAYLFAYGGLLFDLLVVPLLMWRKTRPYIFVVALMFHATNGTVFNIGIFPWVMAGATLIFFSPEWPRKVVSRLRGLLGGPPLPAVMLVPAPRQLRPRQAALLTLVGGYVAFQLLFPLRHWLYPGDVAWTEEGHKFSWRMKLRDKGGRMALIATDPTTGRSWRINDRKYLTRRQASKMVGRPEMILQYAHYVADQLRAEGYEHIEIRALTSITLNGRPPAPLIDPDVDLAQVEWSIWPKSWILPQPHALPKGDDAEG
jgi:vitamin K-dependent gamma-carboxylase